MKLKCQVVDKNNILSHNGEFVKIGKRKMKRDYTFPLACSDGINKKVFTNEFPKALAFNPPPPCASIQPSTPMFAFHKLCRSVSLMGSY